MFSFRSKLPDTGPTIFSTMSATAAQYNAINLGQGFPNFDCEQELKDLICHYLNEGKNQYAPMPGVYSLRKAIADKVQNLYNNSIDPESEVTITAGATQAIFTIITAFITPGDEVILFEPAYDAYRPSVEIAGGIPKAYILSPPDFKIDWEKVDSMVGEKTRMIIINSPQNPTGKILSASDLTQLSRIAQKHDLLVLSDEVYEHLIFDGLEHESVLKYPDLFKRSFAVFSFGKSFHSTGWKVGYCIAASDLMDEFRKIHQWNVFCVNSFIQYALADYLQDPKNYSQLGDFYQQKRDLFSDKMSACALKPLTAEGTYFQLYDYGHLSSENSIDFTMRLIREFGVASIPASAFYSGNRESTLIRFCFAKTDDILEEAASNLSAL